MTDFAGLELAQPILRALSDEGYTTPTPIQGKTIPPLLDGRDVMGVAQTGTGKTASFALPILQGFATHSRKARPNRPFVLILAPTRELATQISDSLKTYGRHLHLRVQTIFGGTSMRPQIGAMARGAHIVVATPGRLLDLMTQNHIRLDGVETFVLDEADRMLDMGFIHDVRKIAQAVPKERQTVLFSATMPKTVEGLAADLLTDPVRLEVAPAATTAERIEQRVLFVAKGDKRALLGDLMNDERIERVLVFTRTKHGADRVARHLNQNGVKSDAIHGNKAQNARQRALKGFRDGQIRALVATDIAARGIDVDGVTHVINFDLPNEPESYVHRIGRTARAGADGIAISFCAHDERGNLRDIERCIRQPVPVFEEHPYHAADVADAPANDTPKGGRGGNRGGGRNRGRGGQRQSAAKGNNGGGGNGGAKRGNGGRNRRRSQGGNRGNAGMAA
ncbi:MAG: DEAD/DEAH box helicase [Rhodospirillaceae bacterium]|nr:DEAD/DEAH box helicase [Rhodospirillaceae bacterium]